MSGGRPPLSPKHLATARMRNGKLLVHCSSACSRLRVLALMSPMGGLPVLERLGWTLDGSAPVTLSGVGVIANLSGGLGFELWQIVHAARC